MSRKNRNKHSASRELKGEQAPESRRPVFADSERRFAFVFAEHPTYNSATDIESNSGAVDRMIRLFDEAVEFLLAQTSEPITIRFGMERGHPNNMTTGALDVQRNLSRNPTLLRWLQLDPVRAALDGTLREAHRDAKMRDSALSDGDARTAIRRMGTPMVIKILDWIDRRSNEGCRWLIDWESPSVLSWCYSASKALNFHFGRAAFDRGEWEEARECYDRAIQFAIQAVPSRDKDCAEIYSHRMRRFAQHRFLVSRGSSHRRSIIPLFEKNGIKATAFGETSEDIPMTRPMDFIRRAPNPMSADERRKFVLMELFLYAVRDLNVPSGMLDIPAERWEQWFRDYRTMTQPNLRFESEAWRRRMSVQQS